MKTILFGNEARQKIKKGIDKCCDVVKVSMGAKGRNVLIYNGSSTEIINDGVSIALEVDVKDEVEQAGIQLAKQCANQTDEDCNDGTTTTLVLLQAFLDKIITDFPTENPRELRNMLFLKANEILERVEVKKVEEKDVYNLALTSSLDKEVSQIISEIYKELGKDAQISIEETSKDVLEKEIVKGMKFESKKADKISEEKQIIENCGVLVLEKADKLEDIQEAVAKESKRGGRNLVVIAHSFSRPIIISILKTETFNIIPIEYKMLVPLDDVKEYAGDLVEKVILTQDATTLIGGNGQAEERIKLLQEKLEKEESNYEKENLEKRIAQLKGKVAVIRAGKNTDVARIEMIKKIEDALGCVKGAYECGYTKGGGKALYEACSGSGEILEAVCKTPYKQICDNAGEEIEIPEEVIDSYKTIKHSLLNALSTATSILMIESALIKRNDE